MIEGSNVSPAQPLLRLQGIRKIFPGVTALDGVDFDVYAGEVHALVGENGAGKSTLIKIIAGVHQPDAGTITWRGEPLHIRNPQHAQSLGIAVIYQEPSLCPDLSVVENILLRRLPRRYGIVQWAHARSIVSTLLSELGVDIPLDALIMDLTPAQRQMVEIAKALSQNAQLLIMDEPTSALSEAEIERLFEVVKRLRERSVAVIYISHRLNEVFAIANRVTVLRDGRAMGTFDIHEVDHNKLVQLMVGRPLDQYYARPAAQRGAPLLAVRNLSLRNRFTGVSFTVHAGEVVGLAGLMGAGRSSVAQVLFGITPADEGEIEWEGQRIQIQTPADAMRVGIVYLPEDRQRQALVLPMSVRENMTLAILRQLARNGFVRRHAENAIAHEFVQRLRIQPPRIEQPVMLLSGGNQQKVALAKWLACKPKLLILDEPTRGIDVGAKAEIHQLIGELARRGMGILLISSELPELLAMSDRVLVMREGRLVASLQRDEATEENVVAYALGVKGNESERAVGAPKCNGEAAGRDSNVVERPHQVQKQRVAIWISNITHAMRIFVKRALSTLMRARREQALLLFLIMLFIITGIQRPDFLSAKNLLDILINNAYSIIAAAGMTAVIIAGGIDISVGSLLAVCAVISGTLAKLDMPLLLIAITAIAVGAAVGFVNGALSARFAIPSIVVTLGMMSVLRGGMLWVTRGYWVRDMPAWFNWAYHVKWFGIPFPIFLMLMVTIITALVMRYTAWGRALYAIGSDANAARLAGIPVGLISLSSFVLCGALTGLAAFLFATRFTAIQSNAGIGFELFVIAAVVVGGTNIFGGSGSIFGSALAVIVLGTIANALVFLHISSYWERAVQGALILMAIGLDVLRWKMHQYRISGYSIL